jgi:hypothetical protein
MDEDLDLEKRAIEVLSVVSSVCFHAGDKTHKAGYHVNLRCGCGAKQVGPIRISSKFPTLRDCLRELGQRIEWDHGPTCVTATQKLKKDAADATTKRPADEAAASLNANDVLMLHRRLKMIQQRAAEANKADLEAEKERDEFHNQIEQIEEQLHPKRARTHDAAGDAHEVLAEVENWDLRDLRQQATRVQNRRNVQLGSESSEASRRHGRLLASHASGSCWVGCILVFGGLCSGSRYHRGVDQDTRSHGTRQ